MTQSLRMLSKSSPPRWVSPLVASTSNTPSSILRSDTSKVPPPRSKTRMVCDSGFSGPPLPFLSRPYASAAAVGSLMMRSTSRPAMVPASLVRRRCASLKYAGTVTTALVMAHPSAASAVVFIFSSTMAEICSGANDLVSPGAVSTEMSALRMAGSPTRRLPSGSKDTQDGVVRSPSLLASTSASPLRHTATQLYVVPRSMPMTERSASDAPPTPPAAASACAFSTAASTSRFLAALTCEGKGSEGKG